jgi:hypothetical protein
MNPFQQVAFEDPCFEAEETAKPKFKHYVEIQGQLISIILTANIGLE